MGEEVSSTTTYQVTSAFAGQSGGEFLRKESFYMDAEDYYDASSRRGSMTSCTMAQKKGRVGGAGVRGAKAQMRSTIAFGVERTACGRPSVSVLLPMGWGRQAHRPWGAGCRRICWRSVGAAL